MSSLLISIVDDTGAIIPLVHLREEAVRHALRVTSGIVLHAARQPGVGRAAFRHLMDRCDLPADR